VEPGADVDRWEIQEVLENRLYSLEDGEVVRMYKVLWKNYSEATWEPEENFDDPIFVENLRKRFPSTV